MNYYVYKPAFPLNNFVENFIYFEGFEPIHNMDRFLPDGNTEFIIDLADLPQYIYDNESLVEYQKCQYGWVSGVRTRPITIPSGRGSKKMIVAFKKGKAFPFYRLPMSELTDQVVDGEFIFGKAFNFLREQLLQSKSIHARFLLIENFLLKQAGDALKTDIMSNCVEFAVTNILSSPNIFSYQELCSQIGYSQKHFIDLFKNKVGVPPKQYLKILRFQKAILEIETDRSIYWSKVALENGFYDQAHFINDFKSFSGFTPNEYLKRKTDSLNYIPVG